MWEEYVILLQECEDLVKKMADFSNHRMFTLRCLETGITIVSCKLKNIIRIPRSYEIFKKVEKQLLNKRIRCLNNTLYIHGVKRDSFDNRMKSVLDTDSLQKCWSFINRVKEPRHNRVRHREKDKFNSLLLKHKVATQAVTAASCVIEAISVEICMAVPVATQT